MFNQIDHIGIAVASLDAATAFYERAFSVGEWERIALPGQHMEVAVARVGPSLIELLAPTSDEAPFAKFLRERGPGMHHIAYRVESIDDALAKLRAEGVQLIDEQPQQGIHNTRVAFVHPKAALGVLVELVEHDPHTAISG